MSPKELLQHIAFECKVPTRLNRYSLKSRDNQICQYFCTNESFKHEFTHKSRMLYVRGANAKDNCVKCVNNKHKIGSVMRR